MTSPLYIEKGNYAFDASKSAVLECGERIFNAVGIESERELMVAVQAWAQGQTQGERAGRINQQRDIARALGLEHVFQKETPSVPK